MIVVHTILRSALMVDGIILRELPKHSGNVLGDVHAPGSGVPALILRHIQYRVACSISFLVATCPDGRLKKWPKRNLNRAVKSLTDLRKDIAERGATYSEPYIEISLYPR